MIIQINELTCGYHGQPLFDPLTLDIAQGNVICILGPNGVGKTTFFKTLLGFLPPLGGEITIEQRAIAQWNRRSLAQKIAYVPQVHTQPFTYSAFDMILMGRTPYFNSLATPSKADYTICKQVMDSLGISRLGNRRYAELSGGEQQMVLIARALAQKPAFLFMDEPTSNLDYGNQMHLLQQIIRLRERDIGVMMITHTPDHAFLCADHVMLFYRDHRVHVGPTADVLSESALTDAYGISVSLFQNHDKHGKSVTTCSPVINECRTATAHLPLHK